MLSMNRMLMEWTIGGYKPVMAVVDQLAGMLVMMNIKAVHRAMRWIDEPMIGRHRMVHGGAILMSGRWEDIGWWERPVTSHNTLIFFRKINSSLSANLIFQLNFTFNSRGYQVHAIFEIIHFLYFYGWKDVIKSNCSYMNYYFQQK